MDYQVVGEEKFLFKDVYQLINEEGMMELELHHFATRNELIALVIDSLIINDC